MFFYFFFFFFNDTATTEIYTLSLHDALPIWWSPTSSADFRDAVCKWTKPARSEEHTSELQSQFHLVCRLLLEKKKDHNQKAIQKLNSIKLDATTRRDTDPTCEYYQYDI